MNSQRLLQHAQNLQKLVLDKIQAQRSRCGHTVQLLTKKMFAIYASWEVGKINFHQ